MPEIAFRIAALIAAVAFMTVRSVFERRLRRAHKAVEYRRASTRDKIDIGIVVLFWWSHGALGGDWSPLVERPPAGTLVTTGPYRYVRHPMYGAFLTYGVGMLLLTSNWIAGIPAVAGSLWMYFRRVDREESVMLETFGDEYRRYAARTGRLLPAVGRGRLAGGRSSTPR